MLLGDGDVEVAVGVPLLELHHARAFPHGRRDCHQAIVALPSSVVRKKVSDPSIGETSSVHE